MSFKNFSSYLPSGFEITLGLLFLLPVFPFWNSFNIAYLVFIVAIGLLLFFGKGEYVKGYNLVDIGFFLLTFSVLISFIKEWCHYKSPPLGGTFLTFLMMSICYFFLVFYYKSKRNDVIISQMLSGVFLGVTGFVFFIAIKNDFNYARLTTAFNYVEGLGNISQVSMYCSFYLIGFFYTQKNKWLSAVFIVLGFTISFILQSKLVLLVLVFLLLGQLLSKYRFKIKLIVLSFLSISSFSFIYYVRPGSLEGRINAFKISWENYDYGSFFGVGLGRYNAFVNSIFGNGKAINTIGEINHLAFNDFTQVFIELGYLGVIGLIMIFVGLVKKENIFYISALAFVLFFMFPLQYLESAILFSFIVFLFRPENEVSFFKQKLSFKYLKPILVSSAIALLCLTCYEMLVFKKWSNYENSLTKSFNNERNLQNYKGLEKELGSMDEYYISFGIHSLKSKKYNEALKAFQKAQKINISYESYIHLGDCYFEMEFFEDALINYDKALLIRPSHLYPVYKSIYCFINLGEHERANIYWASKKDNYKKLLSPKMMVMNQEIEVLLTK